MKCSYCNQPAQAKCGCICQYMCQTHLGEHLVAMINHSYEILATELGSERLSKLKSNILKNIELVDKAKNEIILKTKDLIKFIDRMLKESLAKLDIISKDYLEILQQNKFSQSDMQIVKNIENMNLKLQKFDTCKIERKVENFHTQEFLKYLEKLEDWKIQFLNKHAGGLRCGAVMKDNRTLVTGGSDSVVRVWDLVEQIQLFALHGHYSLVRCLTLAEDSRHIISGSNDASIRIWNFDKRAQVSIFKGHKNPVFAICYIQESASIVSGDYSGKIIIWDISKLTINKNIPCASEVGSLVLTKSQPYLIVGLNPDIIMFKLYTDEIVRTLKGHSLLVLSISLSNNEEIMVSGSFDYSIIVWDLINSKILLRLNGHTSKINSLTLTSDSQFIVSGSDDLTVRVWDLQSGNQVNQFSHKCFVYCILRVDNYILLLSEDSSLGKLEIEDGRFYKNSLLKPFFSTSMTINSNSKIVAYGSENEVCIWDIDKEVEKEALIGHNYMVLFIEISKDGKFAISCSIDSKKNLIYWNLETNQMVAQLIGHTSSVYCACFSKDGLKAASGSADLTVRIWNLTEARQEIELKGHSCYPSSIKFLDNKNLLVFAGNDKKVIIWDLCDQTKYWKLKGHNQVVLKVFVTDDEKFIISCDAFDGIRIWSVDQKEQAFIFIYEEQAASWLNENKIELDSVKKFLKP